MKIKAVDVHLGDVISLNGQEERVHQRAERCDGSLLLNDNAFGCDDPVEVLSFADPKDEEREIMKSGARIEHLREREQRSIWKI